MYAHNGELNRNCDNYNYICMKFQSYLKSRKVDAFEQKYICNVTLQKNM